MSIIVCHGYMYTGSTGSPPIVSSGSWESGIVASLSDVAEELVQFSNCFHMEAI